MAALVLLGDLLFVLLAPPVRWVADVEEVVDDRTAALLAVAGVAGLMANGGGLVLAATGFGGWTDCGCGCC